MTKKFVHLHLHTIYSTLDGAIKIPNLVDKLKAQNMDACAITDHGVVSGAVAFQKTLSKNDIKPIIGSEVYLASGSRFDKGKEAKRYHLVLLAKNQEGYQNLSRLLTYANTEGFYYKARVDRELLEKYNGGLIALSACLQGELSRLILENRDDELDDAVQWYKKTFKDRFYLELQDNGIKEQYIVNDRLIELSKQYDIPIVATADAHYLEHDDAFVQTVLTAIATQSTLENTMKMHTDQLYLKSYDEMASGYFQDHLEALDNTVKIAEQCDFSFKTGINYLPTIGGNEENSRKELIRQAEEGLKKLNIPADKLSIYQERLDFELGIIGKMGYSSYFLIVSDFINWAKSKDIPIGPGRGSGAASLVAYTISITDLDPIEYNLIFERFLNPERVSLPDFDIDICSRRRDEVAKYIVEKYGQDYTAKITTFGFLKARSAIKDVGRVMSIPYAETDIISKLVPDMTKKTIAELLDEDKIFKTEIEKLKKQNDKIEEMMRVAVAVEGSIRQVGIHAAGVIISSEKIMDIAPLMRTKGDQYSTQFDMNDGADIGLVKFDLLGLENLTVIKDIVDFVHLKDESFCIETVSLKDEKVFEELGKGDTVGVFQLESPGMQKLLRKLKPDCFEDIIAVNALYRPGPLSGGVVDDFVERKHGRNAVTYAFPEIESILKETLGIIVYQEQVQLIASTVAGYSLGEADLLRRAMGKKKIAEMSLHKKKFTEGAKKRGFDTKKAEDLFDLMAKFAEYGFNKAHAAVYALIAYRTMFLKTYYPIEFFSAFLSSKICNKKSKDAAWLYISDVMSRGYNIYPVDINESVWEFFPDRDGIRFGFGGVNALGDTTVQNIIKDREENGFYKDFYDFVLRLSKGDRKINKKILENLVKGGAFDSLHDNRASLNASIEMALRTANSQIQSEQSGQVALFGEDVMSTDFEYAKVPQWTDEETQEAELAAISVLFSLHPIDKYQDLVNRLDLPSVRSLSEVADGDVVNILGVLKFIRFFNDKKDSLFSLSDKTGEISIFLSGKMYHKLIKSEITELMPLIIKTRVSQKNETTQLRLRDFKLIDDINISLNLILKDNITEEKILEFAQEIKNEFEKSNEPENLCSLTITNELKEIAFVNYKLQKLNLKKCIRITDKLIKKEPIEAKWRIDY